MSAVLWPHRQSLPRGLGVPQPLPCGCPCGLQRPPACRRGGGRAPRGGQYPGLPPAERGPRVGRSAASPGVILPGLGGAATEPGVACGAVTTDSDAAARTTSVSSRRRPWGQLSTSDPFPGVSSFGMLPRSQASSPDPGPPAPVQGPCEDAAPENAEWPPPGPRPHLRGPRPTHHVRSRLRVPGAGRGCLEPDTPPGAP